MTLLDQMQNLINGIEVKKNETTTIKFQDDRKLWELKDELKKAGYKQTANAYWCHIFEKEGHKVILDREEVIEPVKEVKPEEPNLTTLEIQVLNEIAAEDGNGECILEDAIFRRQYLSILNITVPHKQLRGVLSSLVKKGYIEMHESADSPNDRLVYVTDKFVEYHHSKEEKIKNAKKQPRVIVPGICWDDSELAEKVKLEIGTIVHCQSELEVLRVLTEAENKNFVWRTGDKATDNLPALSEYKNGICIEVQEGGKLVTGALETYKNDPGNFKITHFDNLLLTPNVKKVNPFLYNGYFRLKSLRDDENFDADDIDIFGEMLDEVSGQYDDELDNVEDYWYTLSSVSERDLDYLCELFEKTEEKLEYSYISYDFEEKEVI